MSMLKRLTDLAKSERGKELAEKATARARQMANDPETREKIDAARKKIADRVGGGAHKPAEGAGTKADTATTTTTTGGPAAGATPVPPTRTGGGDDGGKAA